jgi:hypothetical protein
VLFKDLSLNKGEVLVTLLMLLLIILSKHSLVKKLLFVVVANELILEGCSTLLFVILLLCDFVSYTVQKLLVSFDLIVAILLTTFNISSHLAKVLFKDIMVVLHLTKDHLFTKLYSL